MLAPVVGIHEFLTVKPDVDGRGKPGHENIWGFAEVTALGKETE